MNIQRLILGSVYGLLLGTALMCVVAMGQIIWSCIKAEQAREARFQIYVERLLDEPS
jgi:hypothetical protein